MSNRPSKVKNKFISIFWELYCFLNSSMIDHFSYKSPTNPFNNTNEFDKDVHIDHIFVIAPLAISLDR